MAISRLRFVVGLGSAACKWVLSMHLLWVLVSRLGPLSQGFQACTPRIVSLGFGILLRDPRGLHWLIQGQYWGKLFRVMTLGVQPKNP